MFAPKYFNDPPELRRYSIGLDEFIYLFIQSDVVANTVCGQVNEGE